MKSRFFAFAFSGVFFISLVLGCAQKQIRRTPSKKPEVVIANCSHKDVIDALTYLMINTGWEVKVSSDCQLVFIDTSDVYFQPPEYNPTWIPGSSVEARLSYFFKYTLDGIQVRNNYVVVTNPNSAFEREWDQLDEYNYRQIQYDLEQFKRGMEQSNKRSIGVLVNYNGVITDLKDGGGAADAGLQLGDIIIKVDDHEAPFGNSYKLASLLFGLTGTYVDITVIRNREEVSVKALRK